QSTTSCPRRREMGRSHGGADRFPHRRAHHRVLGKGDRRVSWRATQLVRGGSPVAATFTGAGAPASRHASLCRTPVGAPTRARRGGTAHIASNVEAGRVGVDDGTYGRSAPFRTNADLGFICARCPSHFAAG